MLEQLALDYPLPKLLLEYRGIAKLKSTYTDKLPRMVNADTGRVHTNYAQAMAITGRLASNDPNLQNIPVRTAEGRRIREAFIAPPGSHIVSADYSQIELRIMAHISRDASLLKAFAAGEDIHRATAAEIFGVEPARGRCRAAALRQGDQLRPDLRHVGVRPGRPARPRARGGAAIHGPLLHALPGGRRYMQRTREQARDQGYVETVFGRRLWLPEIRAATARAARAPSARRSTRRCRAPPPT